MSINWKDISYLLEGNIKQRAAYRAIENLGILTVLSNFDPILTGTIPIGIDIKTSDLDIICQVFDFNSFKNLLIEKYGLEENFKVSINPTAPIPYITVNFNFNGFEFEVFAQTIPTNRQNAYLHMVIEYRLLKLLGSDFKEKIIQLKTKGLKTEPAFANALNLSGDPYIALLELLKMNDTYLAELYRTS
jgi:hypothetical protein